MKRRAWETKPQVRKALARFPKLFIVVLRDEPAETELKRYALRKKWPLKQVLQLT